MEPISEVFGSFQYPHLVLTDLFWQSGGWILTARGGEANARPTTGTKAVSPWTIGGIP